MPRKRYRPEEIVAKLRQVDVLMRFTASPIVQYQFSVRPIWHAK